MDIDRVKSVPPGTQGVANGPIRVMVVDDSAIVRGLITRMLQADSGIEIVASVNNGEIAVRTLSKTKVDVIILDIEMPVMDGLTALPQLLKIDPQVKVIIASTLTAHNAEISLRALRAGATDCIPKPTTREISSGDNFRRDLLLKVRALGTGRRPGAGRAGSRAPAPTATPATPATPVSAVPAAAPSATIPLRKPGNQPVDVLAIGSSTGGPQALFKVLADIKPTINLPVLITQHMPATFTTILAQHITRMTGWPAREAEDGEAIEAGRIYVAPGEFHMLVEVRGAQKILRLNKGEPENFCRPAADPMLRSVAKAYGGHTLVVILTGMGYDGLKGGKVIVEAGGTIVAQDEASSVVWGMPGAVAMEGLCSAVLPLADIAPHVMSFLARGPR